MLRHVMVPLDGSALAEKAIDAAHRILVPDGKITLLTSVENAQAPVYVLPGSDTANVSEDANNDGIPDRVQAYMDHLATNMKLKGHQVDVEIGFGDPAELIISRAHTLGVEAIVMSTHGRSGLSRLLFGSITLKVLSETPCPVFIVPNREQQRVEDEIPATAPVNLGLDSLTAE